MSGPSNVLALEPLAGPGPPMASRTVTESSPNGQVHDHRTAKVVELVSSSSRSFEEAVQNALEDARSTTRGISGAHIENMSVTCEDGRITAYKVNLKLTFGVERESDGMRRKGRSD